MGDLLKSLRVLAGSLINTIVTDGGIVDRGIAGKDCAYGLIFCFTQYKNFA